MYVHTCVMIMVRCVRVLVCLCNAAVLKHAVNHPLATPQG